MSILSDRQIRELCVCPETYFDRAGFTEALNKPHALPAIEGAYQRLTKELREAFTHPLTDEMKAAWKPMIAPYIKDSIRMVNADGAHSPRKVLSYGSTSYGYDVSLGEDFKVFTNVNGGEIDPKKIDASTCLVDAKLKVDETGAKYVVLPPNSYLLGVTREYFIMPRDVVALAVGKSTLARAGALINITPIEPGFEGNVVIEVANSTTLPMRIYANEGISQFMFFRGDEPCEVSYADRGGKYQGQTGVTLGKV